MKNKSENKFKIPNKENVEAVLLFLPYFCNPKNEFYKVVDTKKGKDGIYTLGYESYNEDTSRFYKCLHNENFMQPFAWGEWQAEAFKYMGNHDMLLNADIITLVKLFTLIIRKNRFCEGFFTSRLMMDLF